MRRSNEEPYFILDCTVEFVREKSLLIKGEEIPEEGGKAWLPKSQFHEASDIDPETAEIGDEGTIAIQMWLAVERGWHDEEEDISDAADVWDM